METPQLNALRDQINDIDEKMLQLLEQRFAIVKEVGMVKQAANLPVKDEAREQAVLTRLRGQVTDPSLKPAIQAIFQ
ncbi:chorismate mutase, partial [Roseburia hominis]|nr:chorismate mutase [Roseburia hominis]